MVPTTANSSFEDAFDELFPRSYGLAFRLLGHVETAEDVAAEALARAFARWAYVGNLAHRDGWVLRVTANLALDALRRRRPHMADPVLRDAQADVDLGLVLAGALRSMPRRQRQVIALRYLADLPADEVARTLRISPGTVKAHIHRGLEALRTRLGPTFPEVSNLVDSAVI
jgi:RNA polymerase sigma-70 factor (ECF subfamily)